MSGTWSMQSKHGATGRRIRASWVVIALAVSGACGGDANPPASDSSDATATPAPNAAATTAPGAPVAGETSTLPQGPADAEGAFRLQGNEPFWGVVVRRDTLVYTTPDYPNGIRFPATAPQRDGHVLRWVAVTQAPEAHTLEVSLEEKACRDTMADMGWTHTATITFDGARRTGCGQKVP
jgi:uncharacterized membrane protein